MPTAEQGRHTPNFFERLGDGRWFGNGRRFGIQLGSLEERINDPHCNDIELLSYLSDGGALVAEKKVGIELKDKIVSRSIRHVNEGRIPYNYDGFADKDLVSFMHEQLKMTGLALPLEEERIGSNRWFDVNSKIAEENDGEIDRILKSSMLPIFEEIILGAKTAESTAFLEAISGSPSHLYNYRLVSNFAYRGERLGTSQINVQEASQRLLGTHVDYNDLTYEDYGIDDVTYKVTEFEAVFPLARAAKSALRQMLNNTISPGLRSRVEHILRQANSIDMMGIPAQHRDELVRIKTDRSWSIRRIF